MIVILHVFFETLVEWNILSITRKHFTHFKKECSFSAKGSHFFRNVTQHFYRYSHSPCFTRMSYHDWSGVKRRRIDWKSTPCCHYFEMEGKMHPFLIDCKKLIPAPGWVYLLGCKCKCLYMFVCMHARAHACVGGWGCGVVWCGVVWCGVLCCVVLCCVVLCCGVVWCVVLCCVVVCCVVLWCGVV